MYVGRSSALNSMSGDENCAVVAARSDEVRSAGSCYHAVACRPNPLALILLLVGAQTPCNTQPALPTTGQADPDANLTGYDEACARPLPVQRRFCNIISTGAVGSNSAWPGESERGGRERGGGEELEGGHPSFACRSGRVENADRSRKKGCQHASSRRLLSQMGCIEVKAPLKRMASEVRQKKKRERENLGPCREALGSRLHPSIRRS